MSIKNKIKNIWRQLKYQVRLGSKEPLIDQDEKPENYILGMTDEYTNIRD